MIGQRFVGGDDIQIGFTFKGLLILWTNHLNMAQMASNKNILHLCYV